MLKFLQNQEKVKVQSRTEEFMKADMYERQRKKQEKIDRIKEQKRAISLRLTQRPAAGEVSAVHLETRLKASESKGSGTKSTAFSDAKKFSTISKIDQQINLNKLNSRQNAEMLRVLQEEQDKESKRYVELQKVTDPADRKRLEKIFAAEKVKSKERISNLIKLHDAECEQFQEKSNKSRTKNIYN